MCVFFIRKETISKKKKRKKRERLRMERKLCAKDDTSL